MRHDQDQADSETGREATELHAVDERPRRISRIISSNMPQKHWYDPIKKVWRHHIRISVPHVDCRDHLGMLSYTITDTSMSSPCSRKLRETLQVVTRIRAGIYVLD